MQSKWLRHTSPATFQDLEHIGLNPYAYDVTRMTYITDGVYCDYEKVVGRKSTLQISKHPRRTGLTRLIHDVDRHLIIRYTNKAVSILGSDQFFKSEIEAIDKLDFETLNACQLRTWLIQDQRLSIQWLRKPQSFDMIIVIN